MATQLVSPQSSRTKEALIRRVNSSVVTIYNPKQVEKTMKTYQVAQQVKYLHLQAEIDVLIQELQALSKQPRKETYATIPSDR